MWRRNSLACCLLLYSLASQAAPPARTVDVTPQINTGFSTAPPAAGRAVISGYKLPRTCVSPGQRLVILGNNFGAKKKVALGGQGITLELNVLDWGNRRIEALVPRDRRIAPGKQYYTGIKHPRTGIWLSNINKTFVICQAPAATLTNKAATPGVNTRLASSPPAPTPAPQFDSTRRPTPEYPADEGGFTESYAEDWDGEWDDGGYSQGADTLRALPNAGGSLMDTQLPPPPELQLPQSQTEAASRKHSVPGELLVVSNNMDQARELAQQLGGYGLSPKRRKLLKALGLVITVFRVPADVELQDIATEVRQSYPKMWVDMNTRYQLLGGDTRSAMRQIQWPRDATTCGRNLRIGMIDTAVNTRHPALAQASINTHEVMSRGIKAAGPAHGTAIASLLVGGGDTLQGLLPAARLYAVNVFQQRGKQVDTTAEWVISALDWLLTQKVNAINMSLGGPRNLLIDLALQRTIQSGVAVVAAAGNSGPGAAPVYPAAQPGVIAVTAVDSRNAIYRKASQGKYIDFAAPGVDIWAAADRAGGKYVSGSSYATPFVTAALASVSARQGVKQAYQQLQKQAKDLGPKGKDAVYGWGLIQLAGSCQ